jgi:heme-degrading monooxygenase HmoA
MSGSHYTRPPRKISVVSTMRRRALPDTVANKDGANKRAARTQSGHTGGGGASGVAGGFESEGGRGPREADMYGTVARMRVKPGSEEQLMQQFREFESLNVPGFVNTYVYRMDAGANEYYMAVVFDSKESYWANARSPEQDARYRQMAALFDGEPEWHDGEIVAAGR